MCGFWDGFFSGFTIVGQAVSSSQGVRLHQDEYHFPGKFIIGLPTVRKAKGRVYHNLWKMSAASIFQSLAIWEREIDYYPFFFSVSYSGDEPKAEET